MGLGPPFSWGIATRCARCSDQPQPHRRERSGRLQATSSGPSATASAPGLAEAAGADLGQQRASQFIGNRVFQCGGVKLLGARHTTIVGNSFRVPVNYAVFIGAAGGEVARVSDDILITANNIIDLLTSNQAGAAVDYNVGILI